MVTRIGRETPVFRSLSARLLVLTIAFVMLGEVLIYAPSAAQFRWNYLEQRISAAHLATLTLEAMPNQDFGPDLQRRVLARAQTHHVGLRTEHRHMFALGVDSPPPIDATFNLDDTGWMERIGQAFATLAQRENRVLRVIATSPLEPSTVVEVLIDEAPLRQAMIAYSWRILGISLLISVLAAGLVFISLQWLMVRPLRRITDSMMAFRAHPEDQAAVLPPSERSDEIGVAQRELAVMQDEIRQALGQRRRLAALGGAVAKINHDLRNSLSTAVLVSDRLSRFVDPEVKRLAERLLEAVDRAVQLCSQTLGFAREGVPRLQLTSVVLRDIADDVWAGIRETSEDVNGVRWRNEIDPDTVIEADREQISRVITNLGLNAFQAGATEVVLSAAPRDGYICLSISDDGPGLPDLARQNLFLPFTGSTKTGGTGLGLVIARDVMRAHGGDIMLARTGADGTTFSLEFPVRTVDDLIMGTGHGMKLN